MEDIDMELALPVRVIELKAGSSRPGGYAEGGPTATWGALGGGGPSLYGPGMACDGVCCCCE